MSFYACFDWVNKLKLVS